MKSFRTWWSVLPASALVLGACEKKKEESAATPPPAGSVVEKAKEIIAPVVAPAVKGLTPAERAAMLGIVGRLSKDSEGVLGIYDGKEMVKRLKSLKTWQFIRETAKEEDGTDPEEEMAEDLAEAGKFIGQEMFIATGKGSGPQLGNLMKVSRRMNYYQMRMLAQAFGMAVKEGDLSAMAMGMAGGPFAAMAKDLGKELPLIESLTVPPVLAGIKAADAETLGKAREELVKGLDEMKGDMGEGCVPVEFTKGGVAFKGIKLLGSFLASEMEKHREDMGEVFTPADLDKLIASVKTKNIVIAHGALDTYLMVYLGGSEDDCPLVEKVEDSLAANEAISFVDGFKDKKVVGFFYSDKAVNQAAIAPGMKDMALGFRDGLTATDAFGDTRELATLLELVGEKEENLLKLAKPETGGGVAVLDEGVKFEFFGGSDYGFFDLNSPHKLGKLGSAEGVLAFGSWITNPAYKKGSEEYLETVVQTAYALTEKVAAVEMDDPEFAQFQAVFTLFNTKFRKDTLGLWEGMQTMGSGLGTESALVVDLKGAMPPLPAVPQDFVDGGKFIRASVVSPVTDRAKLSDAWTKIDGSLKNILKTVSEQAGEDIPMQKPIPSEKNGMTTWFFSFPFFTPDFMPNVTVSDKWFVASTAQNQAQELVAAADSAADARTGAWFEFDYDALRAFTTDWVKLLEAKGEGVMGPNFEEFQKELPRIKKGIEAFGEFDKMSMNQRLEGGKLRTTLHFKVR